MKRWIQERGETLDLELDPAQGKEQQGQQFPGTGRADLFLPGGRPSFSGLIRPMSVKGEGR